MQGGLIGYRAADDRLAVVAADLQALESGGPVAVKSPQHPDLIARVRCHDGHVCVALGGRVIGAGVLVARRSGPGAVICTVLVLRSVICTLRRRAGGGRHPKVQLGWNLGVGTGHQSAARPGVRTGRVYAVPLGEQRSRASSNGLSDGPLAWASVPSDVGLRMGIQGIEESWRSVFGTAGGAESVQVSDG